MRNVRFEWQLSATVHISEYAKVSFVSNNSYNQKFMRHPHQLYIIINSCACAISYQTRIFNNLFKCMKALVFTLNMWNQFHHT